jgi:phage FluMu protein Com
MKCKFCERTIKAEIWNYIVSDVLVYSEIKCPNCLMVQETKWSDNRKNREWESVGEIIKKRKQQFGF